MQYTRQILKLINKRSISPEYVTFFVTSRCNAKCRHCFYWQSLNSDEKDLDCDEIDKIAYHMDPFFFLLITGGEPFLREDIPKIVSIFYKRNLIKKLAIATNGYFSENIEKGIEEILKKCPKLQLTVNISLDGIGESHDTIRGVRGIFLKTIDTIGVLKRLQKHYSNLLFSIIYTFSNLNQDRAGQDYEYIRKFIKPDYFNLSLIREGARDPSVSIGNFTLYKKLQQEVKKGMITDRLKHGAVSRLLCAARSVAKDLIAEMVERDKYITPCYAGKINVVIYPNGDLSPCEILKKSIGNLREEKYNFKKIWFSEKLKKVTVGLKDKECYCRHGCNALSNIIYNPWYIPRIITNYIKQQFFS